MTARWTALATWALMAASVVIWGLKLFVAGTPAPANATLASDTAAPRGDLTRLFGVDVVAPVVAAAAPPPSTRFHLIGVLAPRSDAGREGVALIAVDDKPPRAYRVGAVVDGSTVLQAVRQRGAALGPRGGAADVSLDIPPPAPAATGALPAAGMQFPGVPGAVVQQLPQMTLQQSQMQAQQQMPPMQPPIPGMSGPAMRPQQPNVARGQPGTPVVADPRPETTRNNVLSPQ